MSIEPIPISAMAHFSYCPRRCVLIHLESLFDENLFTLRGTHLHERADQPVTRTERGKRVERALPVWSDQLGLVGRADVIEWEAGVPYPVEYKSGKPKNTRHGAYQLCAQAMCLEEMFDLEIPEGALYFFESNERIRIDLDAGLRAEVLEAIQVIRQLLSQNDPRAILPPPVADKRCRNCSLLDACMPFAIGKATVGNFDVFRPQCEADLP